MHRLITKADRLAARWVPPDTRPIPHPRGSDVAVVYIKDADNGKAYAVAYIGTAARPAANYSFKDAANRDKWIADFFAGRDQHAEFAARLKADRQKPHTFVVGDIIANSWGYDQTNVDWYRVARISAAYVWLQPIAGKMTDKETGNSMAAYTVPDLDADGKPRDLAAELQMHKATGSYAGFKYGLGSKWDGRPMYTSWYA